MGSIRRRGSIVSLLLLIAVLFALTAGSPRGSQAESPTSPPRGISGDGWADVILGQPNFEETAPFATVPNKLWLPHGVIVDTRDPLNQVFYVYDAGNSRILGFDLEDCYADAAIEVACTANLVLGQPDFNSATCNGDSAFQGYPKRAPATAATLCGLQEDQVSITEGGSGSSMAIDDDGALYVTDFWNHRVLKYDDPYAAGEDREADDVWGQDDFSGNECNEGRGEDQPDATSLCFRWRSSAVTNEVNNWTSGVDIDSAGNLWVTDSGNQRALRFPAGQALGAKQADLVLGQTNMTAIPNIYGYCYYTVELAAQYIYNPSAIRVTDSGRVYVNDHGCGSRVFYYDPPYANDGTNRVLGTSLSGLEPINTQGIDLDPTRPGTVWIQNFADSTFDLYDQATHALIQRVGTPGKGHVLGEATGSIGIDADGNLLAAIGVGQYDNDVLLFVKDDSGGSPTYEMSPPVRLFQMQEKPRTDRDVTDQLTGVAATSEQLIVSEKGIGGSPSGGRILFWNKDSGKTLFDSLSTYKPADGYLSGDGPQGQASSFDEGLFCCNAIKVDNASPTRHLWALAGSSVWVYDLPLISGQLPNKIIELPIPLLGDPSTQVGTSGTNWGLLPSADGGHLWVSQRDMNRIIRIRNPLSENPEVDAILGQLNATSTGCGAVSSGLCQPGALSYDKHENIFVSDHALENNGNRRLLVFDPLPDDNTSVIYAPVPKKIFPDVATWEPAFDSTNQLVIGFNPYYGTPIRFPGVFLDPLDPDTMDPDYFLDDYFSMSIGAAFDDDDNLYLAAHNRARILAYKHPLPVGPPLPTPTDTPTVTLTPMATQTPTSTPTPTATPTKQPEPGDTDGDGCSDQRENGPDETLGGLRNYKNPYDFYDVTGFNGGPPDGIIDLPNDILAVILHFSPSGGPPYDVQFDRGPRSGPHPWSMTAPDGVIDIPNDILGVILQFNHSCQ